MMSEIWCVRHSNGYYLVKGTLGVFSANIKYAKIFKDKKSAERDILLKELKRCKAVRIYGGIKDESINIQRCS